MAPFALVLALAVASGFYVAAQDVPTAVQNVQKVYSRVLQRCANDPGEVTWALKQSLVYNNIQWLVKIFATSLEYQTKYINGASVDKQVYSMYDTLLARIPDASGNTTFNNLLNKGFPWQSATQAFVTSTEYNTKFGATKPPGDGRPGMQCCTEDKISQAYCRLLVRCPDFGGFKAMLPLYMDDGRVKEVVRAIAKSPEFQSKYVTNQPPALTIDFLYDRLLARPGDASGKAHWVEQLSQSGSDYKWIVDAFLASPEYVTKFGETKIPGNGRPDCSCCGASQSATTGTGSTATTTPALTSTTTAPACPSTPITNGLPLPQTPSGQSQIAQCNANFFFSNLAPSMTYTCTAGQWQPAIEQCRGMCPQTQILNANSLPLTIDGQSATATCTPGNQFADTSTSKQFQCVAGAWQNLQMCTSISGNPAFEGCPARQIVNGNLLPATKSGETATGQCVDLFTYTFPDPLFMPVVDFTCNNGVWNPPVVDCIAS